MKRKQYFYQLNNFSSLMACLGGLNNAAILRLKHTKSSVPKRTIEMLDNLMAIMSPEKSYSVYRNTLKQVQPPVVPYIGVFLSDLTMLDENPNNIDGLINFDKRRHIHKSIRTIELLQTSNYLLEEVPMIKSFILQIQDRKDDDLYNLSLQIEPRGVEKVDLN